MKKLQPLLLFFLLTACQNAVIADLVTESGQPLYFDGFSDPGSGWPQTVTTESSQGYADGAYHMLVQAPGMDTLAVTGHDFRDVQLEVNANRLAGPVNNRYGLICRYQDKDHFYMFLISSDGYYAIGKVEDGKASLLGQEMMAYTSAIGQSTAPDHLRFDCIGNTLAGTINGQPVALTEDPDFQGGDAGLFVGTFDEGGVDVRFDDFVVTKP